MKPTAIALCVSAFLMMAFVPKAPKDFCTNLPVILKEVGFNESFQGIKGELLSQSTKPFNEDVVKTFVYKPTQDLIPGVPAKIIFTDYPGYFDSWVYRIEYSASTSRKDQEGMYTYWSDAVKKCLQNETGWTFKETLRTYDSEEKVKVWTASKPLDTHFGFRVKNVMVTLIEEKDASFRKTGRFAVWIEVM